MLLTSLFSFNEDINLHICSISSPTSKDWFEDLDCLNRVLQPLSGDCSSTYQQVKIVILDTGLRPDSPYVRAIKRYKDFVQYGKSHDKKGASDRILIHDSKSRSTNLALREESKVEIKTIDNTGHGTHAVHLVFKVLSSAEVSVGRVFETNEESSSTRDLVEDVSISCLDELLPQS